MSKFNIEEVKKLLNQINEVVLEAHPNEDDDVSAIVWNNVLSIAEQLEVDL